MPATSILCGSGKAAIERRQRSTVRRSTPTNPDRSHPGGGWEWWRDTFTASPFWQIGRAVFMPPVDQDRLPASLIERFTGRGGERLIALLRSIAPITGGDRPSRMIAISTTMARAPA